MNNESNEKISDIKDVALKLSAIYTHSPTDYAYLKGWINCLMQNDVRQLSNQNLLRCPSQVIHNK